MVAEIFVSYFFPPCTAFGNEIPDSGTLFPHQHSRNLLDQFWAFCLFDFDLIAPFRVGCTAGKQDPAHSSQSVRSADTFSQLLHSSQHPKGFCCLGGVEVYRGSKAILPTGVVRHRFFCLFSHEGISQCYKSPLFYSRSPPPSCAESNAGVILPTYNDLHIKPRGQQPTLFRDGFFLYL